MPSFESMKAGYRNLWNGMHLTREIESNKVAEGILQDRAQYELVEAETGVPWFWVAITHNRESNRSFAGVLHNGERIIGTGKQTSLVPADRGPFSSWHEAAIDAVKLKDLDQVGEWPLERVLYEFERYNGFGYISKINSPYVWAGTSKQQRGKYIADGQYNSNHWDTQLGAAAILKSLVNLSEDVQERMVGTAPDPEAPDETADTSQEQPVVLLSGYSTDALINELLSRGNIDHIDVRYRKE